jgi:uncharacterized protein (DUF433 family)
MTIKKTKGVCGGSACIDNTRIPVWLCVAYKSIDTVLLLYPDLTYEQVKEAFDYYDQNIVEIDREIKENEDS